MSDPKTRHLVHQLANWGYYLLPQASPCSPGHTGLLVAIRETPTQAHFDPESIGANILDEDGVPEWTTLHREWRFPTSSRVSAGRVILRDRVKKTVEFFTFGGTIESFAVPGETVYSLRSPAPILEITPGESGSDIDDLIFEVETLLARLHTAWGMDDDHFGLHLGQVAPDQLYVASLNSILTKLKQTPALRERHSELYTLLLKEKDWLKKNDCWPEDQPTLEQLLAPGADDQVHT
jgi:hypothetical protein